MLLKELKREDVAIFVYHTAPGRFIVLQRESEDRASGYTVIQYANDNRVETHYWDVTDPEVEFLGKGKIIPQQIIFPKYRYDTHREELDQV